MNDSLAPSTTRREFTGHTLQALLAVSLLEHLNAADLFAAKAKLTARQWLNEVNEIGHAVKGNKLKGVAWQKQMEDLLANRIELAEVLKLIDFERIQKTAKLMDNGARSLRPRFPKLDGVTDKLVFGKQVFALKKGRSVVPHGHNNMATAFLVLKGNFHGRHYDRIKDEKDHLIIKPTIDGKFGPGTTSSVSDEKDNVHWFKALDEPAFIFNIHVLGVASGTGRRTGRVYMDPNGEKFDDGLIRAPRISDAKAHQLYG